MYCPRCAVNINSDDLRFCPACGLSLAGLSAIVAGGSPIAERPSDPPETLDSNRERRDAFKRWGIIIVMFSLMAGCLIPIAVGLRNYTPIFEALIVILAGVAGLLLFGGSSLIVYGDLLPKTVAGKQRDQTESLNALPATTELPPAQEPIDLVSSVTEQTTHQLVPVPRKRR